MSQFPASLPRAGDAAAFAADPFAYLAQSQASHGDLFALRENGPIFSRDPDCSGVVVVLGTELQRAVLTDPEVFDMPVSAAHQLRLPENLHTLNRSLHSMRGATHAQHRRALAGVLHEALGTPLVRGVEEVLQERSARWSAGVATTLMTEMRALMLEISARVLFGRSRTADSALVRHHQQYFELRREASSAANRTDAEALAELVRVGNALDDELRAYIRECRAGPPDGSGGVCAQLTQVDIDAGSRFSEDEIVAHANVLLISSTEPMAMALTWLFLLLSQRPTLHQQLRDELDETGRDGPDPQARETGMSTLLDRVIQETLRLLPPNAFMVRITTRPTVLHDIALPARCEVVLCPFLAHRDSRRFPRPTEFRPERWTATTASPYDYFPFGAGSHACIGRAFALQSIRTVLAYFLPRFHLSLDGDQEIDWRLHIIFMPRVDPAIFIRPLDAPAPRPPGQLYGPVRELMNI